MSSNQKASKEHLELSTFIKEVHKQLRKDATEHGWEETWQKHVNNKSMLTQYAETMESLACKHWTENQQKENSKALSRITWVHNKCEEYFNTTILKCRQQEDEIAKKCDLTVDLDNILEVPDKFKLLDVGSCYNPFKKYSNYEVVAIDIAPSNEEVIQCDFLNIDIANVGLNDESEPRPSKRCKTSEFQCTGLSYHIIVFSLLLDYFPTPELRLKCCENAYKLLKHEGILVIISPDAKHVGANAKYMKSWRLVLAKIGFRRIVYEKLQYLHCMVFRKSSNADVAKRWAVLHEDDKLFDKMYVPQDFNIENK
ncbi:S-adenosylmethionine sensor upstream of mTORC1 [Atheta coriaria]|uniref:S-adenosylmethionine sensor upstream of mTORC1 n=1 Tax=Dalotia coriaria TaxID=877792 RepID=UPI0031F362DE